MENLVRADTDTLVALRRRLEVVSDIATLLGVAKPTVRKMLIKLALSDPRFCEIAREMLTMPNGTKRQAQIARFHENAIENTPGMCLYAHGLYRVFLGWWGTEYPSVAPPSQKLFGATLKACGLDKTKQSGRIVYHDVTLRHAAYDYFRMIGGIEEGGR